jgi:hypothetical protein
MGFLLAEKMPLELVNKKLNKNKWLYKSIIELYQTQNKSLRSQLAR